MTNDLSINRRLNLTLQGNDSEGNTLMQSASIEEYAEFLFKHLEKDGTISHTYDYPFARANIQIALASGYIPRGCGVNAINIIVPSGISIERVGGHDHGNSYHMTDGSVENMTFPWTPIYPDVASYMIDRGWRFEAQEFGSNAKAGFVREIIEESIRVHGEKNSEVIIPSLPKSPLQIGYDRDKNDKI